MSRLTAAGREGSEKKRNTCEMDIRGEEGGERFIVCVCVCASQVQAASSLRMVIVGFLCSFSVSLTFPCVLHSDCGHVEKVEKKAIRGPRHSDANNSTVRRYCLLYNIKGPPFPRSPVN